MGIKEELAAMIKDMDDNGDLEKDISRIAEELSEHIHPALEKLVRYIGKGDRAIMILDYRNVSLPKSEGEFRLRGRITVVGTPDSKLLHDVLTPVLDSMMEGIDQEVLSNDPEAADRDRIEKEWREDDKEISIDDILKSLPKFEAS